MGRLIDLRADAISDLRADIARARHRWSMCCPVCSAEFTLAGDVIPWSTDTCSPRCALDLERFIAANPDLSLDACVENLRDAQ